MGVGRSLLTTPAREARKLALWRCFGGSAMLGCVVTLHFWLIPIVWGVMLQIERRHDGTY